MGEIRLTIGAEVRCTDGACGRLHRIIVEPGGDVTVTYLAVGPDAPHEDRLVPGDLITTAGPEILLQCAIAEFRRLEAAAETAPEHAASWPYPYPDRGPGGRYPFGVEGIERDTGYGNRTTTRDRIPDGGIEIRRGEPVYAVDGEAGRIRGLIVDLPDRLVTGLIVEGGHVHGRLPGHRGRSVVPIESVRNFGDGVQLGLSRDAVHLLPQEEDE